jgi:Hsp70 protein
VSAEILATLRQRAEDSFDDGIFGAVITVPAYFDDAQRQATKDAAQLAGLSVLRLINEPTAAAVAYGLEHGAAGLYAVYDLGGGTFDISLLRLAAGVFEVVATGGDSALGGDDFDHLLAEWALREAGLDASTPQDKRAVLVAARATKEKLSSADHATFACPLAGGELSLRVDRDRFVALTRELVGRTLAAVRKVLRDARAERSDVKGVVMVGGSTRMPMVQAAVAEYFGRRARCRAAGESARRQRGGRRDPAARRDPTLPRPRDDGRSRRTHHPAQQHDPLCARAGLHDLQGRPDGARAARGSGRARARCRLPLAGPLRAARDPADGGRRGAHQGQLPGRRRRPAEREGARGDLGRRGGDRRQAELRPGASRRSRPNGCCSARSRRSTPTATCCRQPSAPRSPR